MWGFMALFWFCNTFTDICLPSLEIEVRCWTMSNNNDLMSDGNMFLVDKRSGKKFSTARHILLSFGSNFFHVSILIKRYGAEGRQKEIL